MIQHLVLIKVTPTASASQVENMVRELRNLPRHVPSIVELTAGRNVSDRNKGFTHGLAVTFWSRADLEAYLVNPEHQRVIKEAIGPILDEVIVMDYET